MSGYLLYSKWVLFTKFEMSFNLNHHELISQYF